MKMTPAAQKRNIPLLALDPLRINHQSHALPVFLQLILTTNPFPPHLQPTEKSLQGRNAISFQPIKVYNWPHAYLINYSSLECNYELINLDFPIADSPMLNKVQNQNQSQSLSSHSLVTSLSCLWSGMDLNNNRNVLQFS